MENVIVTNILKVFLALVLSFGIGMAISPILTHYLYKYKMWKKKVGKVDLSGKETPIFNKLHRDTQTRAPNMGGVIVWLATAVTILGLWIISIIFPGEITGKLNFLSKNQTWLPLFALLVASLTGFIDDLLSVSESGEGMSFKKRALVVLGIGLIGSWWFYFKLDVSNIFVPFVGYFDIGWVFIPFYILVTLALFSSDVIDGIDGLSGGVMATIFATYTGIAFFQNQIDMAAFTAAIVGGLLAFLWFNIPPARFYMSETGMLGLTMALSVVAFLTDAVLLLLVIAFPLVATSASNILQYFYKRYLGRKLFLIAPLHHHFEAIGWPSYKVTMRYWVISIIVGIVGFILAILGRITLS